MSKKNWKLLMEEQRGFKREGASLLFKRVSLLVAIFEDHDFQDACRAEEKNEVDELDAELDDVGFDFLTLRDVLNNFPKEAEWKRGIRVLVAEVMKAEKKERERETMKPTWKERALAAEKRVAQLEQELAVVRGQLDELRAVARLNRPVMS